MNFYRDIFLPLESTTKRLEKIAILESVINTPHELLLKRILDAALNPYRQYFIRQIPKFEHDDGPSLSLHVFIDHLVDFENRSVTGNLAKERLSELMSGLTPDDAEIARRIIIKDLRCGVQESTINKVWPNLIPTYPCLLAQPQSKKSLAKINFPCVMQLKEDGMRANVSITGSTVTITGRSGKVIDLLGVFDSSFLAHDGMVFDGELVMVDDNGKRLERRIGNGILNKAIKGTITLAEAEKARYYVWDAIPVAAFRNYTYSVPYHQRLKETRELIESDYTKAQKKCFMVESLIAKDLDDVSEYFSQSRERGHEGCMLKNIDHIWEDRRSQDLVKMKAEYDCDLRVIGWNPGKIGTKLEGKMGSLICASEDGLVEVSISGFDDGLRDHISENLDSWIGRIITVLYNERIKSKEKGRENLDSLFLARFVELREDKDVANFSSEIE